MRKQWSLGSLRAADWQEDLEVATEELPRVMALGSDSQMFGKVEVTLRAVAASAGHSGHPAVTGTARVAVPVVCQRCLQPMRLALEATIDAVFVREDSDAQALPAETDVWAIGSDSVRLLDVVEESLLMSMPLAPRHTSGCQSKEYLAGSAAQAIEQTQTPFADLKSLLSKTAKNEK